MVQATPFLLVFCLALGAHSLPAKKCNLTGSWVNDLGSNITIITVDANGDFSGFYSMAVSAFPRPIENSPLRGSQHLTNPGNQQPTFGFTVHWSFSDTITVFTGQCFVDKNQKEILKTTWLLRLRMNKFGDNWKATLVGSNDFFRQEEQ
ncbi:AVID protein, partial [Ptilonorhynchus violaceus]|nr:AVID protein [Ptilonorhynchus violaceus]